MFLHIRTAQVRNYLAMKVSIIYKSLVTISMFHNSEYYIFSLKTSHIYYSMIYIYAERSHLPPNYVQVCGNNKWGFPASNYIITNIYLTIYIYKQTKYTFLPHQNFS